ncbi:unnamed protein product [Urochloa humidicola]
MSAPLAYDELASLGPSLASVLFLRSTTARPLSCSRPFFPSGAACGDDRAASGAALGQVFVGRRAFRQVEDQYSRHWPGCSKGEGLQSQLGIVNYDHL